MIREGNGWHLWVLHSPTGPVEAHVVPIDDTEEHTLKETCWCLPAVEEGAVPMFSHNSADGRERKETMQ